MQDEFIKTKKFHYTPVKGILGKTTLTDVDGKPLEHIIQGNVGIYRDQNAEVPEKFLYDTFVYNPSKDQENIRDSITDEIVVYGKIPRRSIRIPLYFRETTSPDFMHVLKTKNGKLSLNLIIETKDYDVKSDFRGAENRRIEAVQKFFDSIDNNQEINVKFAPQLKRDNITDIIKDILEQKK